MKQIIIVDYGFGNLFSLEKAVTHIGANVKISSDPGDIDVADAIVLPGVGAF
ncbi:MAG: imidazole glycerol phosphate synthase subunit HisH, partial [bacterium]|nr:imidazole glycerol phosphate synthase subunit HisH [bacterium]